MVSRSFGLVDWRFPYPTSQVAAMAGSKIKGVRDGIDSTQEISPNLFVRYYLT